MSFISAFLFLGKRREVKHGFVGVIRINNGIQGRCEIRQLTHPSFPLLHEIDPAYPHLLCGIIIEGAATACLALHLDQAAVEESLVEMWTRQWTGS